MVVFGQGDLWSFGISPSDIHRGICPCQLQLLELTHRLQLCVPVAFAAVLKFLKLCFVWHKAKNERQLLMLLLLHDSLSSF